MEQHNTKITSKSIAQSGLPSDYKKAIAEYIWNGFDAKATQIDIWYNSNKLGYILDFSITDNGEGIRIESIDKTFGYFLDSQKRSTFDKDGFVKGKRGKGRFSFSLFANRAIWHTRFRNDENKIFQYDIIIDKANQDKFVIDNEEILDNLQPGTRVEFYDFYDLTSDLIECHEFYDFISSEFGWFLFLNKEKDYSIAINGEKIDYKHIIADFEELDLKFGDYLFKISFIRWVKKIGDKYYYYLLNDNLKEVCRKFTSFNNKAIDFHHSVYIESNFFNDFVLTKESNPVFEFASKNQESIECKLLFKKLNEYLINKGKQFIREQQAEVLITKYHSKKIFPKFKNNRYEKYRQKDLENVVKELYCIQPKIFQGLKDAQSKTIVGFLNLLLDTDQREHVLDIVDNVINLTDDERKSLSESLKKTDIANITKLISFLENRYNVICILKSLVFDMEKFTTERDHIQKVVENNYWLFGEQYHLVSADKNFEIVLNNYLALIENGENTFKKIDETNKLKRPDIFISKQIDITDYQPSEYNIEENIIVELKRPSVIIGKKQYSQVEDYLIFIKNEPRFNSQLRKWKFILIGKTVDSFIEDKYEANKVKGKRFLVESVRNYEIYAMTWDDVFRIFESRHKHLIDKLEFKTSVVEGLKEKGVVLNLELANELTEIAVNS